MTSSKTGMSMLARCGWSLGTLGVVGLGLAAVLTSGCGTPPSSVAEPASGPKAEPSAPGSLSVALAVPPNLEIDTISYQLTKTGFSQAGSLNVARSGTISGVIGGIPAGTGYTLALSATDVAKKFSSCTGSSTVAVTGGATTPVSVAIDCRLTPLAVPVPMPAVVFLAVFLLATGVMATRRTGQR